MLLLTALLLACTPDAPPGAGDSGGRGTGAAADSGGSGTGGSETGGSETGGSDTGSFCTEAPTVTWFDWGQGFMSTHCQGCHASTAVDRHGAPEAVTFDTIDQVWAQVDRILARSTGPDPSMPPAGGVAEDDLVRLRWWLVCGAPGT